MQKNILLAIFFSLALHNTCLGVETSLEKSFKALQETLKKNKKAHYSRNGFDKTINITERTNFSPGLFIGDALSDQLDTSSYIQHTCSIALRENNKVILVSLITKKFFEGIAKPEDEESKTITFKKSLTNTVAIPQEARPQEVFAILAKAEKELLSKWF